MQNYMRWYMQKYMKRDKMGAARFGEHSSNKQRVLNAGITRYRINTAPFTIPTGFLLSVGMSQKRALR